MSGPTPEQVQALAETIDATDLLGCGCCAGNTSCPGCDDADEHGPEGCYYDMGNAERLARALAPFIAAEREAAVREALHACGKSVAAAYRAGLEDAARGGAR